MRFELEHVLAHVQKLEEVRPAGTDAEAGAADYMAEQFHRTGLRVERQDLTASLFADRVADRVAWLLIALLMSVQAIALQLGGGRVAAGLIQLLALLIWLAQVWRPVHARRRWPFPARSQNVLADRLVEPGPNSRIVFLAQLDTFPERWPLRLRLLLTATALLLTTATGDANLGITGQIGPRTATALVLALWLVVIMLAAEPIDRSRARGGRDGRVGLALLLELAGTLSRRTFERVEVRFAAVGAQALDEAGVSALVEQMRRTWANKPTLFVVFDSPSYREGLGLAGYGPGLALGQAAVTDLWIPFRVLPAWWRPQPGRMLRSAGASYVTLVGDPAPGFWWQGSPRPKHDVSAAAPSFPSIVQLATELALRWARGFEPPTQELESRTRSSQKPG